MQCTFGYIKEQPIRLALHQQYTDMQTSKQQINLEKVTPFMLHIFMFKLCHPQGEGVMSWKTFSLLLLLIGFSGS